jgi:hypothetical protein
MGITKKATMKKLLITAICCINAMVLMPAQAGDGHGHGGWRSVTVTPRAASHGWGTGPVVRGGGYGHHHHFRHHGGHGNGWLGPVVAAAVVGSVLYATHNPVYATPVYPPVVVAPPPQVAYYCASYQQYYPNVATCPVPWQAVPY